MILVLSLPFLQLFYGLLVELFYACVLFLVLFESLSPPIHQLGLPPAFIAAPPRPDLDLQHYVKNYLEAYLIWNGSFRRDFVD